MQNNIQAPMQNTIPDALLEMFCGGAYILMLMFLIENIELIRLDQDVKTQRPMHQSHRCSKLL